MWPLPAVAAADGEAYPEADGVVVAAGDPAVEGQAQMAEQLDADSGNQHAALLGPVLVDVVGVLGGIGPLGQSASHADEGHDFAEGQGELAPAGSLHFRFIPAACYAYTVGENTINHTKESFGL